MERFEECRHRSEEKEMHGLGCACSGSIKMVEVYFCHRLGIVDVKPENCNKCKFFEQKEYGEES